jgi:hypothetical protein
MPLKPGRQLARDINPFPRDLTLPAVQEVQQHSPGNDHVAALLAMGRPEDPVRATADTAAIWAGQG